MGFSKFEFRSIGSLRYIEGYLVWRVQNKQARNTLFLTDGVASKQIWELRKNLKFRQHLIVRRIIQIDYCKLCVITQSAVYTPDNLAV